MNIGRFLAYVISLVLVALGLSFVVDPGWIVVAMGVMLYGAVLVDIVKN